MDCNEVQKFIAAYLDGELDAPDRSELVAHLGACDDCLEVARFEEVFRRQLRRIPDEATAPVALRASVRRALGRADRPHWARRWLWGAVPAAAAALVALVVVVSANGRDEPDSVVAQSVTWHRSHVPMDVQGPSFDRVQRYLQGKVPFAVRPPALRGKNVQLVGARLLNLGARPAAYLTYQVGPRRVSVFVFDPDELSSNGREIRVGKRRMYLQDNRGYNVVTYRNGGAGYLVTSDMDHTHLVRLLGQ